MKCARIFLHKILFGILEENKLRNVQSIVEQNISDAFDFAKNSPFPSEEELFEGIYLICNFLDKLQNNSEPFSVTLTDSLASTPQSPNCITAII